MLPSLLEAELRLCKHFQSYRPLLHIHRPPLWWRKNNAITNVFLVNEYNKGVTLG